MDDLVEKFLQEQAKKEQKKTEKLIKQLQPERNAFLLQNGLFKKEYRPAGKKGGRFKWSRREKDANGTYVYYREVPLKLTEEEWQQIDLTCDTNYSTLPTEKHENRMATLLKVLAILVYAGAFVLGLGYGEQAIAYWGNGLVHGSLLMGIGEVITLLHKINLK